MRAPEQVAPALCGGGCLLIRWLVLALLCIGLVGSYFVYDEPAALNLREYQNLFSWLYSAYSWPQLAAVEDDDGAGDDEQVDLRAVLRLPLSLWILTISCVTTYCAILPFNNIASDFIVTRWPTITAGTANYYMAVTYTTAGLVSPFLGAFIDCIGMRAVFCWLRLVITGVHLLLGLSSITPLVGLVFMGLAYSFYAAALWPPSRWWSTRRSSERRTASPPLRKTLASPSCPSSSSRMQVICPEDFECVSLTFAAFAGSPSLLGTPTTPLLDGPGRVDGESVTASASLQLPWPAVPPSPDASGLMVGAGTPISGDSPRLDGAAARRGHPRPRDD
ncbi:hypothetical protein FNF31_07507 [Cafeteria roenbergensis]|uniref:Major facilitator superfamily (MFS) profile domain-containing protein n=1 Tax=Cafeteria roenbergensis TaxID=33653 RepID=A0A5A8C4T6_CAFRO|nr:hypothetical protein FNF31_07507 [Cafeteria roenbergensis]